MSGCTYKKFSRGNAKKLKFHRFSDSRRISGRHGGGAFRIAIAGFLDASECIASELSVEPFFLYKQCVKDEQGAVFWYNLRC
jgi:hypothetical protein